MLFHELETDNSKSNLYEYINIVNTPIFRECSNSILVRTLPIKISLIVAFVLLLVILIFYHYYGEINWVIQVALIVASIASLLSLFLNFFPPRNFNY